MKSNEVIKWAYDKGYRITHDGQLLSPKGIIRKIHKNKVGYYETNVRIKGKLYHLYIHRLCAYQKYGDIIFDAECVRHLDGNPLNNCSDNIEIGTQKDNIMDIPKEVRQKKAEYATSFIRKYNKNEVREFYKQNRSYKKTMNHFGMTTKSTLWFILNK